MTPCLSEDIRCHVWPYFFLNLEITGSDIRPHINWAVSLVIIYGRFNLPQGVCGYVCVNILTLLTPRGNGEGWQGVRWWGG